MRTWRATGVWTALLICFVFFPRLARALIQGQSARAQAHLPGVTGDEA